MEEPAGAPELPAGDAAAEPAAGGIEVRIDNIVSGTPVATLTMSAAEDCSSLKARLSELLGKPSGKIRLVLHGSALANSWRPPSDSGPLQLGLCFVSRTDPEHVEPLPLARGNYWSDNATSFDDGEFLAKLLLEDPMAELASVQLAHNGECVWGILCEYRTKDGIVAAPQHNLRGYGWYANGEEQAVKLELAPGERIVRVMARCGEIMDRLELHTDLGQSIAAGGDGGSAVKVDIEQGTHVFGFSGHRSAGALVRLGFHIM